MKALRWVLWNPWHLALVLMVSVLVVAQFGGSGQQAQGGPFVTVAPTTSVVVGAVPVPPTEPTTVAPVGGTVPSSATVPVQPIPVAAVTAGGRFVAAWASHLSRAAWMAQMDVLATPALRGVLVFQDPAGVPAHTVTGAPTGVGDLGGGLVTVPTDIGPVAVTVVPGGGGWQVSTVEPLVS